MLILSLFSNEEETPGKNLFSRTFSSIFKMWPTHGYPPLLLTVWLSIENWFIHHKSLCQVKKIYRQFGFISSGPRKTMKNVLCKVKTTNKEKQDRGPFPDFDHCNQNCGKPWKIITRGCARDQRVQDIEFCSNYFEPGQITVSPEMRYVKDVKFSEEVGQIDVNVWHSIQFR